jgi:hypothetical protein
MLAANHNVVQQTVGCTANHTASWQRAVLQISLMESDLMMAGSVDTTSDMITFMNQKHAAFTLQL